jgi:hypothetical protein
MSRMDDFNDLSKAIDAEVTGIMNKPVIDIEISSEELIILKQNVRGEFHRETRGHRDEIRRETHGEITQGQINSLYDTIGYLQQTIVKLTNGNPDIINKIYENERFIEKLRAENLSLKRTIDLITTESIRNKKIMDEMNNSIKCITRRLKDAESHKLLYKMQKEENINLRRENERQKSIIDENENLRKEFIKLQADMFKLRNSNFEKVKYGNEELLFVNSPELKTDDSRPQTPQTPRFDDGIDARDKIILLERINEGLRKTINNLRNKIV